MATGNRRMSLEVSGHVNEATLYSHEAVGTLAADPSPSQPTDIEYPLSRPLFIYPDASSAGTFDGHSVGSEHLHFELNPGGGSNSDQTSPYDAARTGHRVPDLVILDEPTTAVDEATASSTVESTAEFTAHAVPAQTAKDDNVTEEELEYTCGGSHSYIWVGDEEAGEGEGECVVDAAPATEHPFGLADSFWVEQSVPAAASSPVAQFAELSGFSRPDPVGSEDRYTLPGYEEMTSAVEHAADYRVFAETEEFSELAPSVESPQTDAQGVLLLFFI